MPDLTLIRIACADALSRRPCRSGFVGQDLMFSSMPKVAAFQDRQPPSFGRFRGGAGFSSPMPIRVFCSISRLIDHRWQPVAMGGKRHLLQCPG